jgi:hypothetical protein
MQKRILLVFAISLAVSFLIANRPAYRGFFTDDDLDNIANARGVEFSYYLVALIKPMISADAVFRPVPDLYYYVLSRTAVLNFTPYVAVIQCIHLLNVFLVWLLARALGATRIGAGAASALFAFHAAMLTIYWRPMYIFDLVSATFALLTLLAYLRGSLVSSVILFWLAMKCKEVVIFLPLVLLAYEWIFGKRRWVRVIPFLAISALFGIWALVFNAHRENDYSLRFTFAAFWTCGQFYASKLVLGPAWAGLAALAVAGVFAGNRLVRFGLVTFFALMLVLLFLPGRLYSAYLYTAFIGVALAISAVTRPAALLVFFALWIPWNYRQLRLDRRNELAAADERRAWATPVAAFIRAHPEIDTFIYENRPETLAPWGIAGTIKTMRPVDAATTIVDADSADRAALARPHLALLDWNAPRKRVRIVQRGPDVAYITLNDAAPLWQLGDGWIDPNPYFRWIAPHATARLNCPADARIFEVQTFAPEVYLNSVHQGRLTVAIGHETIGIVPLDNPDPKQYDFPASCSSNEVELEFDVTPALKDPGGSEKLYGAPIISFGFKP